MLTSCVRRKMARACALVANLIVSWLTETRKSPVRMRPSRWTAPPLATEVTRTPLAPPSTTLMPKGSPPFLMRTVRSNADGSGPPSDTPPGWWWSNAKTPDVDDVEPRSRRSVATFTKSGLGISDSDESVSGGSVCGNGGGGRSKRVDGSWNKHQQNECV